MDDSATHHYVTLEDKHLSVVKVDHKALGVFNSNGAVEKSTRDRRFAFPHVSKEARYFYVLFTLSCGSLYAVGQLCNDGFIALFEAQTDGSLKGVSWFCVAPTNQAACGTPWLKTSRFSSPQTQLKNFPMSMHSNHRTG